MPNLLPPGTLFYAQAQVLLIWALQCPLTYKLLRSACFLPPTSKSWLHTLSIWPDEVVTICIPPHSRPLSSSMFFSLNFTLCADFDKLIMSCIHPYGIIQSFNCPKKVSCAKPTQPSPIPTTLATPNLFTLPIVFFFQKSYKLNHSVRSSANWFFHSIICICPLFFACLVSSFHCVAMLVRLFIPPLKETLVAFSFGCVWIKLL